MDGAEHIYTSVDRGATWGARASKQKWTAVATSGGGIQLVATVRGGRIYISTNSGKTWVARASNQDWRAVASSSDGKRLVAAAASGVYASQDWGKTWRQALAQQVSPSWSMDVAISSSGTTMFAVVSGSIYRSLNSGAKWALLAERRSETYYEGSFDSDWSALASSSNGTKLVALYECQENQSYYFIQTTYCWGIDTSSSGSTQGLSWSELGGRGGSVWQPPIDDPGSYRHTWCCVTSSADGTKLIAAASHGKIYISRNSGATWVARGSNMEWSSVASSSDGKKLVATVNGGKIYTSSNGGATWVPHSV